MRKSPIGGAQFSHIPIPGIHEYDDPDAKLTYRVTGDGETYHEKVYGKLPVPFVSFDKVTDGQVVGAWNLRHMYDKLWEMYSGKIVNVEIDPRLAGGFTTGFDLVVSSVPLKAICTTTLYDHPQQGPMHWFRDQVVRIYNEAIDPNLPDNTIWYNGEEVNSWYRMSLIFGTGSTEWGMHGRVPPLPGLVTVNKPIETNCDCYTEDLSAGVPSIVRVGRYGTWSKGILSFHGYNETVDILTRMGVE
jgi:hypothetical protein